MSDLPDSIIYKFESDSASFYSSTKPFFFVYELFFALVFMEDLRIHGFRRPEAYLFFNENFKTGVQVGSVYYRLF